MNKKLTKNEAEDLILHKFGREISLASKAKKALRGRKAKFTKSSKKNPELRYGLDKSIDFYELSERLLDNSEEAVFKDFTGFTRKYRNKHDKFPSPGDYVKKIKGFNNLYCNKCNINKYCPYFIQDRVCFFFSTGMGMPRITHQYKYHLAVYINYYLWYSSLFTVAQTSFDMEYFMFLSLLYVRTDKDLLAPDVSPKLRRDAKEEKTSALERLYTASSSVHYYYHKEVESLERRWKNLGFPLDKMSKYYPKT
jgi:hypothetical protein